MKKGIFMILVACSLVGCEADVETVKEDLHDTSAKFQTSVTDTIEKTKIEAEKAFNEKKNELLQGVVDDIKEKTDLDLD